MVSAEFERAACAIGKVWRTGMKNMPRDAKEALLGLSAVLQAYFLLNVDDTCGRIISEARVLVAPVCDLLKNLGNRDEQHCPRPVFP